MSTSTKKLIEESIEINASAEAIWNALSSHDSYKKWGAAFHPGSFYEGEWKTGETVKFLGPMEDGKSNGGMLSNVAAAEPNKHILFNHVGVIENDKVLTQGSDYDEWIPAKEEYTIEGGPTTHSLSIKSEVPENYFEAFSKCWTEALSSIKTIAEGK